jgi:thiol-disulfide isomerase/thioredoxin
MKRNRVARWIAVSVVVLASVGVGLRASDDGQTQAATAKLAGLWEGTVVVNKVEVPFPFEIVADGSSYKASFFNGERRFPSLPAAVENGGIVFKFESYASKLNATIQDDALVGEYQRARGAPYPFRAVRAKTTPVSAEKAPSIGGTWIVTAKSTKGETAWRFIVDQKGPKVSATILRVDGDTGTLTGSFRNGMFVLSHFSGARPLLLEVTPNADGTLTLSQNKQPGLLAARENVASTKGIGAPTDPALHTSVKDPSEPLRFSFPDLNGKIVSNTDPQFRGKVVLVNISGSWCPNCHDEAPFLASLYKKYHAKGFEMVTLSFEEADQLANPTRLRSFIQNYGITWTVLIPGDPDQLNDKVPQGVNLNAFPTSFILGRDGRVRAVHAGFPSPGSGEFYSHAEKEVTSLVEKLLAEAPPKSTR